MRAQQGGHSAPAAALSRIPMPAARAGATGWSLSTARGLTQVSILVGVGTALHVVESWIPVPYVVPGLKLGLANVVTVYALYSLGRSPAALVAALRSVLGSMLGGTFLLPAFAMSFAGASASALIMGVTAKDVPAHVGSSRSPACRAREIIGISIAGAITHNVSQLVVAMLLLRHVGLILYSPFLVLMAIPMGVLVGLLAGKAVAAYKP